MSAEEPIDITESSERVWRFEPSPGSRAVWENDMLVEMIYRYVHRLEGPRAVINGMILCKRRFWLMARILYRDCHVHGVVQTFVEECPLVSLDTTCIVAGLIHFQAIARNASLDISTLCESCVSTVTIWSRTTTSPRRKLPTTSSNAQLDGNPSDRDGRQ
jgi:hypothetical protein